MKKFTGNTRKEELTRLAKCYNTLRIYFFVLIGLAAGALITAIMKYMIPSMLCLVALALFRLTIHKKARNDYQQAITDAALTCSVGAKLDEFELSSKGGIGITREDIPTAELMPVRDGSDTYINFFQGIAGSSKGTEVSLNDTVLHQYQHAGQKGAAITCGVWMRFVLPKDAGRNIRLMSNGLLADDIREEFFAGLPALTQHDTEEAGFKEGLFLYEEAVQSNEEEAVFLPVPTKFSSAVNRLARKTSVPFGLSLKGNVLSLFFKDRVLAPTCDLNSKPDDSLLKLEAIPEFGDALSIAKNVPSA